jgi:hypothetical protein
MSGPRCRPIIPGGIGPRLSHQPDHERLKLVDDSQSSSAFWETVAYLYLNLEVWGIGGDDVGIIPSTKAPPPRESSTG